MNYFKDKVTLITGAGSGIGRALAEKLVQLGAKVIAADFNRELAEKTGKDLNCPIKVYDVRDLEQTRQAIQVGEIDILFNNAGMVQTGQAHTFEYDDWKQVIDVNLYGIVNAIHCVYPSMVERKTGHIINTASIAGLFPMAGQVSYVASKHAVVGLSQALRAEAAALGVKVTVLCPGIIKTPMRDKLPVKTDNPEKLLEILPEGMKVDECVDEIIEGVAANRGTVVITPMAHALSLAQRVSPDLGTWVSERLIEHIRNQL